MGGLGWHPAESAVDPGLFGWPIGVTEFGAPIADEAQPWLDYVQAVEEAGDLSMGAGPAGGGAVLIDLLQDRCALRCGLVVHVADGHVRARS